MAVILLAVISLIIEARILIGLVIRIYYFRRELTFINNELRRADRSERPHWQREKKRLWLSPIPFYDRWKRSRRKR